MKGTASALEDVHLKISTVLPVTRTTSAFNSASNLASKYEGGYETLSVVVENLNGLVQFLDYASKVISIVKELITSKGICIIS